MNSLSFIEIKLERAIVIFSLHALVTIKTVEKRIEKSNQNVHISNSKFYG